MCHREKTEEILASEEHHSLYKYTINVLYMYMYVYMQSVFPQEDRELTY